MYGNAPIRDESAEATLTPEQRKNLRDGLSSVENRTRELLPGEFVVGSEIVPSNDGPRATIAVQPPVGPVVSANYTPEEDVDISADERDDIATGLAASAALQVKDAMSDNASPTAK
jgi:hypothetical protein